MNTEEQMQVVRDSKLRALRAIRAAMTALLDARSDVVNCFAGDPDDGPEEIEAARVEAWKVLRPLLLAGVKTLNTFIGRGMLGADVALRTIEECNVLIAAMEREPSERESARVLEQLHEQKVGEAQRNG